GRQNNLKCPLIRRMRSLEYVRPAANAPDLPASPRPRPKVWNPGNAWLGREDSNLRMAESKSAALPLGDAPSFAGVVPARAIPIRRLALLRNMLVTSFRDAARRH